MVAGDDDYGGDRAQAAQRLRRAAQVVQAGPGGIEEVAAMHDQVGGEVVGDVDDFVQNGVYFCVASMAAELAAQVPVGCVQDASRHGCLQEGRGSMAPTVHGITGRNLETLELW